MRIVLPGALPDPREARELAPYLQKSAPTLHGWFSASHAQILPADPDTAGCTAYEQWLLADRGFRPNHEQSLAAGLGPLLARGPVQAQQATWLVELVHVAPSRDGAALLPARDLDITAEQSVALFESVQELFAGSGFTLYPSDDQHWRIDLPAEFSPTCASPDMVSTTSVNDWWPQDMAARPWRRLVNEVQMHWFEHPINRSREEQGLPPINSLWLFGGARADQFSDLSSRPDDVLENGLSAPALRQDWNGWLAALAELEQRVFKPLEPGRAPELVLTGRSRIVQLRPSALKHYTQWLPASRLSWRRWWSPQD
ncbi:MAG TPA: hypothetical protein VNQ97_13780 [Burkholderiaceae bacterium]|nr:hypothetical protein [Burkholderiaceae bacterium]